MNQYKKLGKNIKVVISDMNQPLGNSIGNSLEVIECIETLKGNGPKDLTLLCLHICSEFLYEAKMFDNIEHMNDFLRFLQRNKQWKTARVVKKKKDCDLALYVLKAKLNKVDNIPKKCRMSNFKALRLMRKHCSYNLYSWYLNQIYPFWTKYDAYFHKVEKIIMK